MGMKKHKPCNGTGLITIQTSNISPEGARMGSVGGELTLECEGCAGTGRVTSGKPKKQI